MFKGKLGTGFVTGEVKKAYTSWRGQCFRCSNPRASDYKYYGAKGIRVEYKSREFVNWWLSVRPEFPPEMKVSVDRLDPAKNYCFDNIRMISHVDNVIESNQRTHFKGVRMYRFGRLVGQVRTLKEAEEITGLNFSLIARLRGTGKTSTGRSKNPGWTFKYGKKARDGIQGSFFERPKISAEHLGREDSASSQAGNT